MVKRITTPMSISEARVFIAKWVDQPYTLSLREGQYRLSCKGAPGSQAFYTTSLHEAIAVTGAFLASGAPKGVR